MRNASSFPIPVFLLTVIAVLLVAAPVRPAPLQAGGTSVESITGSVHKVDADARTLEIITGVGHALRLVSMQVDPACDIKVEGATASLGSLKAGQVVRIRYGKADGRKLAYTIETLPKSEGGGGR